MYRARIIPVLLLQNRALVKSVKFKNHKYIGDPINAVRIFNDLNADELVFLDIDATKNNTNLNIDLVREISEEANMPFSFGGGIRTIEQIRKIISNGAEKVVIGSYAVENPDFIKEAVRFFGSSTITVCLDIYNRFNKNKLVSINAKRKHKIGILDFAQLMEKNGAGELIVQSVNLDGSMTNYDSSLIKKVSENLSIPIVSLGGAKDFSSMIDLSRKTFVNGFAAGSMFVYQNQNKGVLINYPSKDEKLSIKY